MGLAIMKTPPSPRTYPGLTSLRGAPVAGLDWDGETAECAFAYAHNTGAATIFDASPYGMQEAANEQREPSPVSPRQSFVRIRPDDETAPRSERLPYLETMGEKQLQLGLSLVPLEDVTRGMPYDPSARAAAETLATRAAELFDLHDALQDVWGSACSSPELAPLFAPDASLTAYVGGIYMWCERVVPALTDLARDLRILMPDWHILRGRLDDALTWYFDGLADEVRREMKALPCANARFVEHVEELFWTAAQLAQGLAKRFG